MHGRARRAPQPLPDHRRGGLSDRVLPPNPPVVLPVSPTLPTPFTRQRYGSVSVHRSQGRATSRMESFGDHGEALRDDCEGREYIVPVTVTDVLGQSCSRLHDLRHCPPSEGAAGLFRAESSECPTTRSSSPACGSPQRSPSSPHKAPPELTVNATASSRASRQRRESTVSWWSRGPRGVHDTHEVTIEIDCPDQALRSAADGEDVPYDQTIIVTGGSGRISSRACTASRSVPAGRKPHSR